MPRVAEQLPRFRVWRETADGLMPAVWPDEWPVQRTGLDPERSLAAAIRDAEEIAAGEPDATFLVLSDAGEVLHRLQAVTHCPF